MELLVKGASKRDITIQLFNNQTMKYSAETFWDKIEKYLTKTYDKHIKTNRYYIDDNIADVFDRFNNDNENVEEEEEEIDENELVGKWIDEHKNKNDDFEYVLMTDINKEKDLKQQIIEALNLEDMKPEDIDENASLFGEGLGLDSIDALELIVLMEKNYGIKLKDPAQGKEIFKSVAVMADYISKNRTK